MTEEVKLAEQHLRLALPTPLPTNPPGLLGKCRSWSGGLGQAELTVPMTGCFKDTR